MGLAVITTIFTDFAKDDLVNRIKEAGISLTDSQQSDVIGFILGSGSKKALLDELGTDEIQQVLAHIHHAFVTGIETGLGFAAFLVAIGAVLCIFAISNKGKPSG